MHVSTVTQLHPPNLRTILHQTNILLLSRILLSMLVDISEEQEELSCAKLSPESVNFLGQMELFFGWFV